MIVDNRTTLSPSSARSTNSHPIPTSVTGTAAACTTLGTAAPPGVFSPRVCMMKFSHISSRQEPSCMTSRAAEDLMGLSLPNTTPAYLNLHGTPQRQNQLREQPQRPVAMGSYRFRVLWPEELWFCTWRIQHDRQTSRDRMSKRRRKDGVLEEHKYWSIILRSEVRSIIWGDNDFYQAVGVVVRDENSVENSIKLRTYANGKALRTSNIILAAGSVQSPAILLRGGKKNFLESNEGFHLADHDIFVGLLFPLSKSGRQRANWINENPDICSSRRWHWQWWNRLGQLLHWCRFFSSHELYTQPILQERKLPQVHRCFHPTCASEWEKHHRARCRWRAHCDHASPLFRNTDKHVAELKNFTKEAMQVSAKSAVDRNPWNGGGWGREVFQAPWAWWSRSRAWDYSDAG